MAESRLIEIDQKFGPISDQIQIVNCCDHQ